MTRPALWVELCCGSAAVSLRLIGGASARPPVAYMGGKRAYGRGILNIMGLQSGQGSDAVVLVEAGPWAKVWAALVDPATCHRVADVLRGWKDEDPKALWDRLKADPIPLESAEFTAAWTYLQAVEFSGKPVGVNGGIFNVSAQKTDRPADGSDRWISSVLGPGDVAQRVDAIEHASWPRSTSEEWSRWVARWLWLNGRSFGSKGEEFGFDGGNGWNIDQRMMAERVERMSHLQWPAVDPEHIARWVFQQGASYGGFFGAGHCGFNYRSQHDVSALASDAVSMSEAKWSAVAVIQADVFEIHPPDPLPDPTFVYLDPPYHDVTGYQFTLSRERVLEVAQRWSDAGAVVCVSEDEPLPIPGWHHVDISECFTGMGRTFSRSRSEWVTINRDPAWTPAYQLDGAVDPLSEEEDAENARAATAQAEEKAAALAALQHKKPAVSGPEPVTDPMNRDPVRAVDKQIQMFWEVV